MSDQTPDRPSDDDLLEEVLAVISELARKSAGGDYLYRGEPKCYPKVSSGLYRKYEKIAADDFDIGIVQNEMLESAKEFVGELGKDDDELLDQLQHYGYRTNLIDFTTDYHIALFFACDGEPEKRGRVILLDKTWHSPRKPRVPDNRVIAQKSMFVQPTKGFVEPSEVVVIPHRLKDRMLKYLDQSHGVSAATIYNDLHGFIRYHGTHASAYAAFYEGLVRWDEGNYDAAIDCFSKSIELNRRYPAPFLGRGALYAREGAHDLAIQDYDSAIELNPRSSEAYANRGAAYSTKGDYDRAIQDCDRAIQLDPRLASAYTNRGSAYWHKGENERATRDLSRVIELSPRSAESYTNRAAAYRSKGDYDSAIRDYEKAIELNPTSADAYANRGAVYREKGDYDLALQDHNRAIELSPDFAGAYTNRGTLYREKGDYDLALQDHNRAVELDPRFALGYDNRGIAYFRKGDYELAIRDYDRAIDLDPKLAGTYYNRAESRLILQEWEEAESDLSTAQSLGFDIVSAFSKEFGSIPAFERKHNVKLPASIAQLLTRPQ